ncbi:MAG TPA: ATP-dependent helicase, partial [Microbacteriaceae bacterium]|nr:ATP-dependent helicase [Microbacteriaceae bacterium]
MGERKAMFSAARLAATLGLPEPTPQQKAIIESPLGSALVVAGAGSGKTETMSSRIVWLLANGWAKPQDILGLTFTRKAAGEMAARFRARVTALGETGLLPGDRDPFDTVTVATYNSFANSIYRDHALLLGREPDGVVLGEASAWRLARRVVLASRDERLAALDKSAETLADAVLALSRALASNVADGETVAAMAREFTAVAGLPPGGRGLYAQVEKWALDVGALDLLVDLAARYQREKVTRGVIEYSDQVALALGIVESDDAVRREIRGRYRVILLDEYQDTSVVQTRLLSTLFRGRAVLAVGDPNQSIYGWRGASAAGLARFPAQFDAETTFRLTVSWRNGRRILDAANTLAAPLAGSLPVARLQAAPHAGASPVDVRYEQTVESEADVTAGWLAERLSEGGATKPTAALLLRSRAQQQVFLDALERRAVPYHVLGLGGLLEQPAVADLVSALRVVADVSSGGALVRLLAGARWRIGLRDLRALRRVAGWLAAHDAGGRPLAPEVRRRLRGSVAEGEGESLSDAVDFVRTAPPSHPALAVLSAEGRRRIGEAGALFARLRARRGLGLHELAGLARQELLIDIELLANEARPATHAGLDAFSDAIDDYLAVGDEPDLRGFLHWLAEAARRDGLGPRPEEPEAGTVQVLTIHGAKGLEWDHVAVPLWTAGDLPARQHDGTSGWLRFGEMPYEFRGDRRDLPSLPWRSAATRKELVTAVDGFKKEVTARHADEERRLAYVALTRARHRLLLSGSFWATGKRPRLPSPFLADLAEAGLIAQPPAAPDDEANPRHPETDVVVWPADPLGTRRVRLEEAARR